VYFSIQPRQTTASSGELEISPTVAELGQCKWRDSLKATFAVKNTSTEPIQLVDVARTCSCEPVNFESKELQPGESTTLMIRWDAGSGADDVTTATPLLYQYRDGRRASTPLAMKVRITPDIRIEPSKLNLADVKARPVELMTDLRQAGYSGVCNSPMVG